MKSAEQRFWGKVDLDGPIPDFAPELGQCWIWIGSKSRGYGHFYCHGRNYPAHRWHYESTLRALDEDRELDHLCRVKACVRLSHLEVVTHQENCRRGVVPGDPRTVRKDRCIRGHLFDEANTRMYRNKQQCRACDRDWQRIYRVARRVA